MVSASLFFFLFLSSYSHLRDRFAAGAFPSFPMALIMHVIGQISAAFKWADLIPMCLSNANSELNSGLEFQ